MADSEKQLKTLKFPRSIPLIILTEFCERFCFFGMRAILVLYLESKLNYSEDDATMIFHIFIFLAYFSCVFGAILADSFIGQFKTILMLSIVYAIGSSTVTIGSVETWNVSPKTMTFLGLILIAIGSGGIKPCVSSFGGDQFKLPEQVKQLGHYFFVFYFTINLGSLISSLVTPILRDDLECFGVTDCYPAGFGLPALLMIISVIAFASGKFMYKTAAEPENILVEFSGCICNAIRMKHREKKTNPKEHWLDYAEAKYGKRLVMETRILLNVLILFLPLPVFWALYDQQGSRWIFQATRMNGDLGFYTIKPDQMQVINPLMILLFIPLCEFALYPLLSLIGIRRPLQKMTLGGFLAVAAFLWSTAVQIMIDHAEHDYNEQIAMLWQLPQYILMTLAEVMFSVTGLEFSFTEAPEGMRSVVSACWLLTVSFGNLIVIFVVRAGESIPHKNQAFEFFTFASMLFVDMFIFMILSKCYKSIPLSEIEKLAEVKQIKEVKK